jgi:DNA-binding NtrC family response regulator
MPSILFVDDEATVRQNYDLLLRHHGFAVTLCASVDEALAALERSQFDLIVTDMRMAPKSGMDLLRVVRSIAPAISVIVMTGHAEVANAIEAMKLGAVDYITKDTDHREIVITIQKAIETVQLREEIGRLREELHGQFSAEKIVGNSRAITQVLATVRRVAPTDSRVLITGESGTGKELVAETIHANSGRANFPFIAINCGAIPKDLQESELFGHVRGAFTGADRDRKGLLESATHGTVFLDEVGEMAMTTQVKLLRFLETAEFFQVGSSQSRKTDVRILAATNRNLEELVTQKLFRVDLLYRLKVVVIHLPALRERREDIPKLGMALLKQLNPRTHTSITSISKEAEQALMEYQWPGNVRELKNVLERAMIFSDTNVIELESLPEELFQTQYRSTPETTRSIDEVQPLDEVEKAHILKTLQKLNGNKLLTAQQLNIATTTLYRKLRRYGIE